MKSNLYNAAYRSCTVGTQLAFAACGTQLSARLTRPQPLPWTVCPLTWKALIFFYILALECIRDLAVVCVVMSFAPITVPGVQEYSWSKRMKEFIFQKKKKRHSGCVKVLTQDIWFMIIKWGHWMNISKNNVSSPLCVTSCRHQLSHRAFNIWLLQQMFDSTRGLVDKWAKALSFFIHCHLKCRWRKIQIMEHLGQWNSSDLCGLGNNYRTLFLFIFFSHLEKVLFCVFDSICSCIYNI